MKNSFKILIIKGVPIQLHWTFLLLIIWVLAMQVIGREPLNTAILTIGELLAVFLCVLFHELGHTVAARHYNIPISKIQLLPIGGLTYFSKQPATPRQEIAVAIAGPLVNIFIALAMIPLLPPGTSFWKVGVIFSSLHSGNFWHFLYNINLALAIINLLPALPLDGGKVTRGVLGLFFSSYTAFQNILIITKIFSWLMAGAGLLTGNLLFIFYGCFLLFASSIEKDNYIISYLLKDENVGDVICHDYKTLDVHISRQELLNAICSNNDRYYVLTDKDNIVGILDRETILFSLLNSRETVALKDIILPDIVPVQAGNKLTDIWNQLPSKPDVYIPVTSTNQHVIGVISRDNIISNILQHAITAHKKPLAFGCIIPLLLSLMTS